jgi:hypothetical protein
MYLNDNIFIVIIYSLGQTIQRFPNSKIPNKNLLLKKPKIIYKAKEKKKLSPTARSKN